MSVHDVDAIAWTVVAPLAELPLDRGVAVLVDGQPVALFRLGDGTLAAIDHVEPITGMPVLARGLVGSAGDVTYVSSPLHKQRYDLVTGQCLDDASVSVRTWSVTVIDGLVHVAAQPDGFEPDAFVPGTNAPG